MRLGHTSCEGPNSSTRGDGLCRSERGVRRLGRCPAGLTTNHQNDVMTEVVVEELRRLDGELERLPRFADVEEFGDCSGHTYLRGVGSWSDAKEAA